ncbi:hypothetical protein D3C76_1348500 [compost metagenome]
MGHEAAVAPQVGNTQGDAIVAEAKSNNADATQNHGNNSDDLDQGEPEFKLAKGLDREQVDRAHASQCGQCPDPARDVGEPDAHIDGHRRDFRHAGHQPQEPVVPAGQKTCQWAKVILGVTAEGTCNWVVHGHFAERAHDDQNRQAANDV